MERLFDLGAGASFHYQHRPAQRWKERLIKLYLFTFCSYDLLILSIEATTNIYSLSLGSINTTECFVSGSSNLRNSCLTETISLAALASKFYSISFIHTPIGHILCSHIGNSCPQHHMQYRVIRTSAKSQRSPSLLRIANLLRSQPIPPLYTKQPVQCFQLSPTSVLLNPDAGLESQNLRRLMLKTMS